MNTPVQIPTESLDIESPDGATVRANLFTPMRRHDARSPTCLILPAMGAKAAYYQPLATALAAKGWAAATVDLRGQGESSERAASRLDRRAPDFGYREIVHLDLPAAARALEARRPEAPLVVLAHSLSGQLATLSSELGLLRHDGLVLVAAGAAHWKNWPLRQQPRCLATVAAITLAAKLLPRYPGSLVGFGGDQPKRLMRDWSRAALKGNYGDLEPHGRRNEGPPVLVVGIEGDQISPSGAVDSLANRFPTHRVRRRIHVVADSPWSRHFTWVKRNEAVVGEVIDWYADVSEDLRQAA